MRCIRSRYGESTGFFLIASRRAGPYHSRLFYQRARLVTTQLTPEQHAVVQHQRGHARVIAVAGAGKTSTLTHFVLARLQEGLPAKRMLVLMYNKAAQQDFEQRLSALADSSEIGRAHV